jgi:hypothetical protein
MKFAWYVYTKYVMELAMEETIWAKTKAERGQDNQSIRHGICLYRRESDTRTKKAEQCQLQMCDTTNKAFPSQTG